MREGNHFPLTHSRTPNLLSECDPHLPTGSEVLQLSPCTRTYSDAEFPEKLFWSVKPSLSQWA